MKELTEEQIKSLKQLAKNTTSTEDCGDDWNPYDISGGNYDDAYYVGYEDAEIENARFILNLFELDY
jgi:hypothetical protein